MCKGRVCNRYLQQLLWFNCDYSRWCCTADVVAVKLESTQMNARRGRGGERRGGVNSLHAASHFTLLISFARHLLVPTLFGSVIYLLQGALSLSLSLSLSSGFLLRILWCCSKVAIIQENHLAKIVIIYILDMGSRNQKQHLFLYSLLPTGNIHKILAIWKGKKKNSSKSSKFAPFLSFENLWIVQKNHLFQVETWRKFTSKRELWSPCCDIRWTNTTLVLDFILFYFSQQIAKRQV